MRCPCRRCRGLGPTDEELNGRRRTKDILEEVVADRGYESVPAMREDYGSEDNEELLRELEKEWAREDHPDA